MRIFFSFVGGLVAAALIFGGWFTISEQHNHRIPRYQLEHGTIVTAGGKDKNILLRLDTVTGQTWVYEEATDGEGDWFEITRDHLLNPLPQATK